MNERQQRWLASLPPAVRAEAEAEIAYYDDETRWEFEEYEETGEPAAKVAAADSPPPLSR